MGVQGFLGSIISGKSLYVFYLYLRKVHYSNSTVHVVYFTGSCNSSQLIYLIGANLEYKNSSSRAVNWAFSSTLGPHTLLA